MTFTAQDVAKLRQKTGAGMMECKNALQEAKGNLEKASEILRQKGLIAAAKKAEKTSDEGIVTSKISSDKKLGVLLEINTQTDFVARNDSFIELAQTIADSTLKNKPKSLDELLQIKVGGESISNHIANKISTIGENIKVRRFAIYELKDENGIIGSYVHPVGNKIGVLVKLISPNSKVTCIEELAEIAKDISMHIAASQPQPEYVDKSQIPQDVIAKEKSIELGKEDLQNKPLEIREKIVQGRLDKILAQRCLTEQPFIKDQTISVSKYLNERGKKLGIEIKIADFVRFNVGELIDKHSSEEHKSPVGSSKK